GLVALYLRWLRKPSGARVLTAVEGQGWFDLTRYKRTQGLRARRLTMLGILALSAWGILNLIQSPMRHAWPENWTVTVPFTSLFTGTGADVTFTLLPDPRYTVPILFALFALWFAYRVVNFHL